ncbi:MAG: alpha/beta hydrolase [Bacteroidetes bacterium]|nr:alpha/beta hydrolase [Bacteroidota bacterium]
MRTKPSILLLHGALGAASQFDKLEGLLSSEFDVHRYDFPGHGGKAFAEHPLTMPILAEHLLDHISEFHLIGTSIFGYSMGGYAALWLEKNKTGCFSSIMTLGTKFNWNPELAEKESKLIHPDFLESKSPHFTDTLKQRHSPNDWKKLSTETSHLLLHLGKHPLLHSDFENIDCPVRLAVGDRDMMVGLEETANVYSSLPNASLLVMPETPHLLEKVNHNYLAEEIIRFNSKYGVQSKGI